jgi:plastocyanin
MSSRGFVWPAIPVRALLAVALLLAFGGVSRLVPSSAGQQREPREVTLVARNMTFYVSGDSTPNPTIRLTAGENVRVVLRNEDAGIEHDFSVSALDLRVPVTTGASIESAVMRVPLRPGGYEYVCTPHAQMMKGRIEITE